MNTEHKEINLYSEEDPRFEVTRDSNFDQQKALLLSRSERNSDKQGAINYSTNTLDNK